MKVTVIAVGKMRDEWVRAGCDEYLKRLKPRLPVEIIEVKSGEEILRRVPARDSLWVLDEDGKQFSSEEFAQAIGRAMSGGDGGLSFVIGGADGYPKELKARAKQVWSFGKMTLPHRLARLILVEQLYRAVSIVRGEPYHR